MAGKETHRKTTGKKQMTNSSDVDRGWSWVVLMAAFLVHLISHGFIYTFGLYFIAIEDTYGGSKAAIAWIPSIITGGLHLIGPFASTLVNKYGCQLVGTLGAGLAFLGMFLSLFARNIYILYVTMGTLTGAGIGLMFLPSVLSVTVYFKKYRGTACGIGLSGCGVGIFVFSPLSEYLLKEYGLKGTVLIISGLMLNCIPFCLMYRPFKSNQDVTLKRDLELESPKYVNSQEHHLSQTCKHTYLSQQIVTVESQNEEQLLSLLNANIDRTDIDTNDEVAETKLEINGTGKDDVDITCGVPTDHSEREIVVELEKSRLTEIKCSEEDSTLTRYTVLLKRPQIVLFLVSQFLFIGTAYIPFIFIPDKAKSHNINERDSAWVAPAIGMSSIAGRITLGFVADRPFVNKKMLFKILFILCGLSTACCSWLDTLWSLLVYGVVYGTCMGTIVSLTSVVLLDTVGLTGITDAIGLNYMISGLGGLIGPPFVGSLYDLTDTYTATFMFAGGAMVTAGMMIIGL